MIESPFVCDSVCHEWYLYFKEILGYILKESWKLLIIKVAIYYLLKIEFLKC